MDGFVGINKGVQMGTPLRLGWVMVFLEVGALGIAAEILPRISGGECSGKPDSLRILGERPNKMKNEKKKVK